MKVIYISILLLIFQITITTAQNYTQTAEIQNFEGNFTTDPLGNVYLFSKGDITKFSPEGIETGRFSTREFGDITHIDATNPMKVLVVYADFSKAIVLDASLGKNAVIDLSFLNVQPVKVICSSRENGYWLYDPVDTRLERITDQLEVAIEGTPFRQISTEQIAPLYLYDSGNWLIMSASNFGFLIFDRFGTYYKTIDQLSDARFQANGDEILFKDQEKMTQLNIKKGITQNFLLPENDPEDQCRVEGKHIFLKRKNILKIFSY